MYHQPYKKNQFFLVKKGSAISKGARNSTSQLDRALNLFSPISMINCNQKMHETISYFLAAIHAVFLVTGRKNLTLQIINCHGKNFLSQKGIFFQGQKILFTRKISCHKNKFLVKGRTFAVTGRNFLPLEEISCHKKKLLVTGRNFMP